MARSKFSRWFIAVASAFGATVLPAAGAADTGGIPVDPPACLQQWLDSPTHRRVLLTKSWRELGIGLVSAVRAPGAYGGRDVEIAAAEFGLRSH
jgi:hypothetical protein